MKKNKFSLYFVFISFFTLSTVFISLVQKSYFNLLKPQNEVKNNALLKEINPNLDLSIISEIESRDKNNEEDFDFSILDQKAKPTLIPTLAPTITPKVTPKITPKVTPTPIDESVSILESDSNISDELNTDTPLDELIY
jgi:hypothetical protein